MDIVKKDRVKSFLKQNKMRTANNLFEAVNQEIEALLKRACQRADKNGRTTVMKHDL